MRILMDVDGVVADLVGGICQELQDNGFQFTPADVWTNAFEECMTAAEAEVAFDAMAREGFCASIPWYPGARAFVTLLQHMGQLVAVTKPFGRGRTWAHERAAWLDGIPVVSTDHKEFVAGNFLIEDLPENLDRWLQCNPYGRGILLDRPWNRVGCLHRRAVRARGYVDALTALRGPR